MAGWTKEDYDAAYRFRVERYFGGHPSTRGEVKVHYHRWAMKPFWANRWRKLQLVLNILPTDDVCVIGSGFGWGVEAITAETGATVVGIDISDYIAAEQGTTEEAELRAEIALVGLDPDTGRGLELMGILYDAQPRANVIVLQEDAKNNQSRQRIRAALNNNWPSVVVYEDIVDDTWADQDIIDARNAGNGFGGQQRLIWIYRNTPARTLQNLFDLLPAGSEVISTDTLTYLT